MEIIEIVKSLRSSSAAGHDKIPVWIVKNTIDLISEPICNFVNFSIETGIVPDQMKIARLIPIYKSGENNLFSNYRPISVLPIFSKILERVVYNRLMDYININQILFRNQYGFRKNHSTSLALISLYDKISAGFDANKHTVGIFLDLSKAFDTVDHAILISKLDHYGIRGLPLAWIQNYLSNKFQYVEYNGFCSLSNKIKCGVPQGSILGPLLFLLCINDLCNATEIGELILFADDTNLVYSHDNVSSFMSPINSELSMLNEWSQANKLSVNISKTNYIIFKPRQRKKIFDFNLKINNKEINRVNEVCFLGIILDENLSWKAHISHVAHKISKSIGIIYRSSFYLFKSPLRMLYYALVFPYLQYCITVWGSTYPTNLNRLVILQKRVVRIIDKQDFGVHTSPTFNELKILKLEDIYFFNLAKFIYKYKHNLLPDCFECPLLTVDQVHNYNTRNSKAFYVPSCRTNFRKFSVNYQGPMLFNTLNSDIRNSSSIYLYSKLS